MKVISNLFILGSIAMSLALPQLAFSADGASSDGSATQDKAKIDETKGHDRGFGFAPYAIHGVTPAAVSIPGARNLGANKPIDNASSKKTTVAKVANTGNLVRKPIITAVQKTIAPKNLKKETGKNTATASATAPAHNTAKPTTTPDPVSNDVGSSMLVKYSPDAGTVISAKLDHRGTLPSYKVGEKMVVNVKANQDCNVVVFNFDSTGTLTQIFPNDYQPNGFVKAGDGVEIGGADSPFDYQIAGKGGPEKVFVYAYPTGSEFKNPMTAMGHKAPQVAMAPIAGTPFRGAEMTVDDYRKLVNGSQVFFSRSVEVKPKAAHSAQIAASQAAATSSPNKVELTFVVDK